MKKGETKVFTIKGMQRQRTEGKVSTIEERTIEQTKDEYYRGVSSQRWWSGSKFYTDRNGRLVWKSKIDCCLWKVVPVSLRERFSLVEHYIVVARQPGDRRMFDTLRNKYSGRTWKKTFISRFVTANHVLVNTNVWNENDNCSYFLQQGLSNVFLWSYLAHCHRRKQNCIRHHDISLLPEANASNSYVQDSGYPYSERILRSLARSSRDTRLSPIR